MGDQSSNPSLQWLWLLLSHWKHTAPASSIEPYSTTHYFLVTEPRWDFPWGEADIGSTLAKGIPDRVWEAWVTGTGCVTLGESHYLSEPWNSHLCSGYNNANPWAPVYSRWKTLNYKSSTTFIILMYINSRESIYYIEMVFPGLFFKKR